MVVFIQIMETNKKCLNSGEPIPGGRSDKKFSNDLNRSRYHNKKRREKLLTFKRVDNQLHLNHEILEKYYRLTNGEKSIPLELLLKEGFTRKWHLRPPFELNEDTKPDTFFYSYKYKFVYDKGNNSIKIYKIQWKLKRKFIP